MAGIDLSKYGITGAMKSFITLLTNYYSKKKHLLKTKVMKSVRKANLAQ